MKSNKKAARVELRPINQPKAPDAANAYGAYLIDPDGTERELGCFKNLALPTGVTMILQNLVDLGTPVEELEKIVEDLDVTD